MYVYTCAFNLINLIFPFRNGVFPSIPAAGPDPREHRFRQWIAEDAPYGVDGMGALSL